MVIPALKEQVKKLTSQINKTRRNKSTSDQQISMAAYRLRMKKKKSKPEFCKYDNLYYCKPGLLQFCKICQFHDKEEK